MTRKNKNPAQVVVMPTPQPPPQRKRGKRKAKAQGSPRGLEKFVTAVCAITDPFCPHAEGTKWPDGNAAKSLPVTLKGAVTISTSAQGNAAAYFVPGWKVGYGTTDLAGGSFPAGTTATFNTVPQVYTGAATYAPKSFRLVCGGIKVMNVGAPLNSSGTVTIIQVNGQDTLDMAGIDFGSYNQETIQTANFSSLIDKPVCAIFKPGGPQAHMFTDISTPTATNDLKPNDFSVICVALTGGDISKAVLRIEYVLHYELLFGKSDIINLLATHPPPANPTVTGASQAISSTINDMAFEGARVVGQEVAKAAKRQAMKLLAGFVAGRLGGPGAGRAAYTIMDVD